MELRLWVWMIMRWARRAACCATLYLAPWLLEADQDNVIGVPWNIMMLFWDILACQGVDATETRGSTLQLLIRGWSTECQARIGKRADKTLLLDILYACSYVFCITKEIIS